MVGVHAQYLATGKIAISQTLCYYVKSTETKQGREKLKKLPY